DMPLGVLNNAGAVFDIATAVVDARMTVARGDRVGAIAHWQRAVDAQDRLAYDEPPAWYYPVRESLGAALVQKGDAAEAERVFRPDLEPNAGNGRSLFGLWQALEAQHNTAASAEARRQLEAAWKSADVQRTLA